MSNEETVVEAWKDVFRTLREVERAVVEVEEEENVRYSKPSRLPHNLS